MYANKVLVQNQNVSHINEVSENMAINTELCTTDSAS